MSKRFLFIVLFIVGISSLYAQYRDTTVSNLGIITESRFNEYYGDQDNAYISLLSSIDIRGRRFSGVNNTNFWRITTSDTEDNAAVNYCTNYLLKSARDVSTGTVVLVTILRSYDSSTGFATGWLIFFQARATGRYVYYQYWFQGHFKAY